MPRPGRLVTPMLRLGVLISGRGSNLQALIEACQQPDFPAHIQVVISNRADATGLDRARAANIPTYTIDNRSFVDRVAFEAAMSRRLAESAVDLICLAGFMRILGDAFLAQWQGKVINIHPSLLPAYKGLYTHARALADGMKMHGCTVHWVVPELDAGPIIAQAQVPVLEGDTPDSLAARVLDAEHQLYPQAVRQIAAAGRPLPLYTGTL